MRLPRWVVCLLIILMIGATIAAGVWWLFAPGRNTERFISSISTSSFENANAILTNGRWVQDEGNVAFESDGKRVCCFPPAYWPRIVSGAKIERPATTWTDLIRGRRRFGAKEIVYQVTLRFEVGPSTAIFRELDLYQKNDPGTATVYKEHGHYGFSARVKTLEPLLIHISYSFGDPDGGFIVLTRNDVELDRQPSWLGVGNCMLTGHDVAESDADYRVVLMDRDGNIRNKTQQRISLVVR